MHKNSLLIFCLLIGGCASNSSAPTSAPRPNQGTIVAFGDSLTAGYGLEDTDAYPAQLQQRLEKDGLDWRVSNAGLSGETSTGARERVDWVMRLNPQIVILETGANDGLRGIDPKITGENLEAIVDTFQKRGVKVVLAGMRTPQNLGEDYSQKFAALYPRLANSRKLPLIPFFLEGVAGKTDLNQEDRMHPTKDGYSIIVGHIAPLVEKVIRAKN